MSRLTLGLVAFALTIPIRAATPPTATFCNAYALPAEELAVISHWPLWRRQNGTCARMQPAI